MTTPVQIGDDGTVTGDSVARDLYDSLEKWHADRLIDLATPHTEWPGTVEEWATKMGPYNLLLKREWARNANAHAEAFAKFLPPGYVLAAADKLATSLDEKAKHARCSREELALIKAVEEWRKS